MINLIEQVETIKERNMQQQRPIQLNQQQQMQNRQEEQQSGQNPQVAIPQMVVGNGGLN